MLGQDHFAQSEVLGFGVCGAKSGNGLTLVPPPRLVGSRVTKGSRESAWRPFWYGTIRILFPKLKAEFAPTSVADTDCGKEY